MKERLRRLWGSYWEKYYVGDTNKGEVILRMKKLGEGGGGEWRECNYHFKEGLKNK